ncbi:hypothetical protein [Microbacterium arborescens]|uniref:hypothetical protein n=1 Tax=Microbacterium arborescens TaxID=33883 RepID=UPI00278324A9|nr:hypothetical protein [Microbacterium arborescens]MDQ1217636.1 hypothetical protein [Microbacterium arborescens]
MVCITSMGAALVLALPTTDALAAPQLPDAGVEQEGLTESAFTELPFAHPVSLEDATTVTNADGVEISGYRLLSDAMAGDYWPGGALTLDQFLEEVARHTGTVPEVVGAYVDAGSHDARVNALRSEPMVLGAHLPRFDAPDPVVGAQNANGNRLLRAEIDTAVPRAVANPTWWPVDAAARVTTMGDKIAIRGQYAWYGSDPYASPLQMADGWGMEFQFDFYSTFRDLPFGYIPPPGFGTRPICGHSDYKDWASASNREFTWFAQVLSGTSVVVAPGALGLYGDYNTITDPCDVSTVAVGMADPWQMPHDIGGMNQLDLYMYPSRGQESTSVLGAIVQPVNRDWCERNSSMPLTDCMGVTPGDYPGPGPKTSRMVLNNANKNRAPNLCWYSGGFGLQSAQIFTCNNDL